MASLATKNPHEASAAPRKEKAAGPLKALAKIGLGRHVSEAERVTAQWAAANGCPISDEAKKRFTFHPAGMPHEFVLADVRVWREGTKTLSLPAKEGEGEEQNGGVSSSICLEFFFDGETADVQDPSVFGQAFERLIEEQLQERRMTNFREKYARRTRMRAAGAGIMRSRNKITDNAAEERDPENAGAVLMEASPDEEEWQKYLNSKVPETRLAVRAFREAGCMLRFVCVQTSLSVGASDVLGQVCFPEYFPVDGVPQTLAEDPNLPWFPSWHWVGLTALCVLFGLMALFAWYKTLSEALAFGVRREGGGLGAGGVDPLGVAVAAGGGGGGGDGGAA